MEEYQWLTSREAAKSLGIRSVNTVKRYLGRLPPEMVKRTPGKHWRIREDALVILASLSIEGARK